MKTLKLSHFLKETHQLAVDVRTEEKPVSSGLKFVVSKYDHDVVIQPLDAAGFPWEKEVFHFEAGEVMEFFPVQGDPDFQGVVDWLVSTLLQVPEVALAYGDLEFLFC